ncbi:hypothetical protein ACFL12_05415 [Pseudomonadota bacterium]
MTIETIIEKATLDQRFETARAFKKPRSLKRVLRMAERALVRAEQAIDHVTKALPPPAPIACGPGCPYCCHIRLTASAPEVLLVLDHIRGTWPVDAIQALAKKVKNIDPLTRGKDDDARAKLRLPCPLLKDGSCSVHMVRPLSCRALACVDLPACKAAYNSRMAEGVPMFEPQHQTANAVGYGLYAGLVDAGYGVENIELVAALALGLDDKEIGRNWLTGEDVFAPACALTP